MLHMRAHRKPEGQEDQNQQSRLRQRFSWRTILLRILPRILIRLLLPLILYQILEHVLPVSEWMKLCIAATVPLFFIVFTRLRTRRLDPLSILMLSGLVLSLLLELITQDSFFLSLREPLLHGLFGLICLGSLVFSSPLAWTLYKYLMAEKASRQEGWLDRAFRQDSALRSTFRLVTLVAGCVLLAIGIVHVSLLFSLRGLLASHTIPGSLTGTHTLHASRSLAGTVGRFMVSIGVHVIDIGADILLGLWALRKLTSAHRRLRNARTSFLATQATQPL